MLHPEPKTSLQIGFGVGNSLAAAALHPDVEEVEVVELSSHIYETAPFFWTNADVLNNPKVRVIIDDGRNYLLRTPKRYDVITLEPPDIFTAGVVNLYTEEFYRLAYNALEEDGVLSQWLPVSEMEEIEMRMLVGAFAAVFPNVTIWREGPGAISPLLLIGTKSPLRIDRDHLQRLYDVPTMHEDLVSIGLPTVDVFLGLFICGAEGTRRWVGDAGTVTDDLTWVDFSSARTVHSGFGFGVHRLKGESRVVFDEYVKVIRKLYADLQEPIAPLMVGLDS